MKRPVAHERVGRAEDKLPACHDGNRLRDDGLEGHLPPGLPVWNEWVCRTEDKLPACHDGNRLRNDGLEGHLPHVTLEILLPASWKIGEIFLVPVPSRIPAFSELFT